MAKGKFSQPRHSHSDSSPRREPRYAREPETASFNHPTENPLEGYSDGGYYDSLSDRSMPEVDFHSFEDLAVDELSDSLFSSQEGEEETPMPEGFAPIPPRYVSTEEEDIERSFQQAMERSTRRASSGSAALRRFWVRHKLAVILSSLGVLAAVLIITGSVSLFHYFSDPYDHLILSNVSVAGVDVGGMTKKQAQQAVSSQVLPQLYGSSMVVALPDQSLSLTAQDTGIDLDVDQLIRQAYRFGRTGSDAQMEEDYRFSLTQNHQIDLLPFLRMDTGKVKGILNQYGDSHSSTFIQSSYALEGDQPPLDFDHFNPMNPTQTLLLIPGSPGFAMDADLLCSEILSAYSRLDFHPRLSLPEGDGSPDPLDLHKIHEEYTILPVNSSIDPETTEVVSGSYGYTFDLEYARTQLQKASYGDTVRIPMTYMEPDTLDHEVFFQDVLSHAETPHGKNKNRNENLRLACEAIDGVVLQPGDEFSYNDTLGQRTADKGYKPAPAYSGEVLVDSLGGGICQVSSTLYWSSMLADMEITDRINHGFPPTYMSVGLDATVSWGGPDFKFRNSSSYPIQIHAEATDELVIVEILGTDDRDYYVEIEVDASYSDPDTVYQEYGPESGYTDGQILQNGITKHYAKTYRCKYSKETNELISREPEARSSYMGKDTVIAVVKDTQKPDPTDPPVNPDAPDPDTTPPETQEPVTPPTDPGSDGGGDSGGNSGGGGDSGGGDSGGGSSGGGGDSGGSDNGSPSPEPEPPEG